MKRKTNYYIAVIAVLIGIIIGFGIGYYRGYKRIDTPAKSSIEEENTDSEETTNLEETLPAAKESIETETLLSSVDESSAAEEMQNEWKKEEIYTGGEEVVYQTGRYRAKWWTEGEEPKREEWGAWEYLGEITPSITAASLEETETAIQKEQVKKEEFKVVVYYPSWRPEALSKIRYDIVTHIIYAFAIPTVEGELRPLDNIETAKQIIQTAHQNNIKVMLAVGGWSYNDTILEGIFRQATETEEKREKFANAIVSLCEDYQFDGIDMDWEHPRVDDASQKQYEELMLLLEKKLHEKGKLLTAAVVSGATADGMIYYDAAAHSDAVLNAVDWIHVMAYDGGDGERHSSYEFAVNCGAYWKEKRQMPACKVVLGVPFYGRPSWSSYQDILALNPDADKTDISAVYGTEVWYNGVETIQKKTRYAIENLGGIMVWEVTQDTMEKEKSLLNAIGEEIKK